MIPPRVSEQIMQSLSGGLASRGSELQAWTGHLSAGTTTGSFKTISVSLSFLFWNVETI